MAIYLNNQTPPAGPKSVCNIVNSNSDLRSQPELGKSGKYPIYISTRLPTT
jgi:hypothetical protein